MALPTAEQSKIILSFDMVAKTMTATFGSAFLDAVINNGLLFSITEETAFITDPLGETYDVSSLFSAGYPDALLSLTFNAPTDSVTGEVINGAYNIGVPSIDLDDAGDTVSYTDNNSAYTLNYTKPTITISHTLKCSNPASFVSTDETVWNQYNPNGSTVVPETGTNYQHNLNYPVNSDGAGGIAPPTETSDISITRGPEEFFNGVQTSFVSRDLTWTFSDGLVVTDTVNGTKWTDVDCDNQMCAVTCGLTKLWRTWMANKNTTQGNLNRDLMVTAAAQAMIGYLNINCGDPQTGNEIAAAIKTQIGACCDGCSGPAEGTPVTGY